MIGTGVSTCHTWTTMVLTACCLRAGIIQATEAPMKTTCCSVKANNQQYIESNKYADGSFPPGTPSVAT